MCLPGQSGETVDISPPASGTRLPVSGAAWWDLVEAPAGVREASRLITTGVTGETGQESGHETPWR